IAWRDIPMPGIAMENCSPRATSHRRINLISSDCELLIRAPSNRRSLFSVCDPISAVISTACEWCMSMPRMNSTSACDRGGSVALVEGGSVLLGLPGAPGCTTTGVAGSVCRERAVERKKSAEALAASNMPQSTADLASRSEIWFMIAYFGHRRLNFQNDHRHLISALQVVSQTASGAACAKALHHHCPSRRRT